MKHLSLLPLVPHNPQHFYDSLVHFVGINHKIKFNKIEYVIQVGAYKDLGIFKTAYGYFFVSKYMKFSKIFYGSYKECFIHAKKTG